MAGTAGKFVAHVWRTSSGKIIKQRAFKTGRGAVAFAERESVTDGIKEVSVTYPHDKDGEFGPRAGVARNGKFTNATPQPDNHIDTKENIMAKKDDTDTGEDVTTTTTATPKTRAPKPALKYAKDALTLADLLGMSDSAIMKVPVERRAKIEASLLAEAKLAEDAYTESFVRFLSGNRKHPVQAFMHKLPAEQGVALRNAARKKLGKALGLKPAQIRLDGSGKSKAAA